jgi:predicted transposase YbfD/YdcC
MEDDEQLSSSQDFFSHFSILPDPRVDHTKKHLLLDILFIAICTVICGGETFTDMSEFGKAKSEWLGKYLELPYGIPSHDTFRAVLSRLDPAAFSECFMRWTSAIHEATRGEVIALDGKTIRHSFDKFTGQEALHLVSAWASESGLALGQVKVDSKSNEITAIPKLLKLLDIKGCIVTMDAMGCQKEIAKQIINSGGNYLFCLKGNQESLHDDVKYFFDEAFESDFEEVEHRYFESIEKEHGRIETRKCWMVEDVAIRWLGDTGYDWPGIRSIGAIQAQRKIGENISIETRYFISSIAGSAKSFARAARSHWGIENSLHWVLDVTLNEDASRIRRDNAPENLAVLRKIALNLAKRETSTKISIRRKLLRAGWDDAYLEKLLVS